MPLNALLQWRAPDDRRGAVIALTNVLVFGGMLAGSLLALALAGAGRLGAGDVPGRRRSSWPAGFVWALSLVPDAFLRFLLILLAHTLYRAPGARPGERARRRAGPC